MPSPRSALPALVAGVALALSGTLPAMAAPPGAPSGIDKTLLRAESRGGPVVAFGSGRYLTGPSSRPATQVALDYLRKNRADFDLSAEAARSLTVVKDVVTAHDGAHHVVLGQELDGLRVSGAVLTALVDTTGRLVLVGGPTAETARSGKAAITAGDAIVIAARRAGAKSVAAPTGSQTKAKGKHTFKNTVARGVTQPMPLSAELVWHRNADRTLRLAWLTDVEVSDSAWFGTTVDASTGTVLASESRYDHSGPEGNVITGQHYGDDQTQEVVPFTGVNGTWVAGTTTSGNNVNAYLDRNDDDANNEYQPNTPAMGDPQYQHFNYTFTNAWNTTADQNSAAALDADRDAIITQLFWYNNDLHDWLWARGFDEASGNFQTTNFSGNGTGGDAVLAEAQDGYNFGCDDGDGTPNESPDDRCRNNARFSTDGDGTVARMQMYMSIPGGPYADGSMDGDVIAHEYGHGVSNRLVPGTISGGTNQAGSLGEGWSDTLSFLRWGDATFAEYMSGDNDGGWRNEDFDDNTETYGDYSLSVGSPHRNSEIWASTMYDIREGIGLNDTTIRLVLDGMRNTAGPNPTYLNARDGILAADMTNNGGANQCELWTIFAGRGMGENAISNGLHAVPTEDFTVPAMCLPTAEAGGPYNTNEGTDVALTGSGTKGSDPSSGAITAYAWDLDNDGQYDDSALQNPSFTDVGQDDVHTVGLQVTDAFGNTATDTATVTVANVAPVVSINAITPSNEGDSVTISGSITDPGWEDTLTAMIDYDDGAGASALSGTLENVRPNATFAFSVNKTYGDNGTFTVTVTGFDDDTSTPDTENAVVNNVDPTSTIDSSGEQVYDGKSAFVLEAGEDLTVPATSTDPGSDDLTFTWLWGDSTSSVQTSLVNPPATDPAKSPSVQPRNETLQATHSYGDACLFNLGVKVEDDDAGLGSDSAVVLVTGNADTSKGHGWWLNQYRPKPPHDFTPAELQCYLDIANYFSLVFSEHRDADSRADATQVLNAPAKAPEDVIFDQFALGAWLNFANGSVKLSTMVDTTGDGIDDMTFGAAMLTAETVRINPASTSAQVKAQKNVLERVILQSE